MVFSALMFLTLSAFSKYDSRLSARHPAAKDGTLSIEFFKDSSCSSLITTLTSNGEKMPFHFYEVDSKALTLGFFPQTEQYPYGIYAGAPPLHLPVIMQFLDSAKNSFVKIEPPLSQTQGDCSVAPTDDSWSLAVFTTSDPNTPVEVQSFRWYNQTNHS